MATKGFNCILFDFDSIIDKEISLLKYFSFAYKDSARIDQFMSIGELIGIPDDVLRFGRMYGSSLFKELLVNPEDKARYEQLIDAFFERDQEDIFDGGFAYKTTMLTLISAYRKAGGGIISTAVRCDNQHQLDYIKKQDSAVTAFISPRDQVDMSKYARLIVGNYKSALQYILNEPKNIVVLNFKENFDPNSSTVLRPELVINLGDINEINVASAYQEDEFFERLKDLQSKGE